MPVAAPLAGGRVATALRALRRGAGNARVGRLLAREARRYRDVPIGSPDFSADDKQIDKGIAKEQAKKKDALGNITGLDAITDADERRRVRYLIWQYFWIGNARHEEIDAVVTIRGQVKIDPNAPIDLKGTAASTDRTVLFTLRFTRNGNVSDVEVVRIGQLDLAVLDITHVAGFPGSQATASQIQAWAAKRFPELAKITPGNKESGAAYAARLGAERAKRASTPAWFKANYGFTILTAAAADARLKATPGWASDKRRADLKEWEPDRLLLLEQALEPVGDVVLGRLRDVALARQRVRLVPTGSDVKEDPKAVGETIATTKERTVLIFDSLGTTDPSRFAGGAGGARKASVLELLHELGHAVSWYGGNTALVKRFNDQFVSASPATTAPTEYGRSNPASEFFAEAFSLFHADPEYLKREHPKVFEFFEKEFKPAA